MSYDPTAAQLTVRAKSDEQLLNIISAHDRLALPLARRFEGDDAPIVDFMTEIGLKQDVVSKLLACTLVMREAISRGLALPEGN